MPTATAPEAPPENPGKTYRMRLLNAEYLSEFDGRGGPRLPAGAVVDVDTDTAVRWLDRGIAVQAPQDARTLKDMRRARLLARLEALDAEDDEIEDEEQPEVFGVPKSLLVQPTSTVRRRQKAKSQPKKRAAPKPAPHTPVVTDDAPSSESED